MTEYELNKVNQGTMRVLLINKHKDPWGKKKIHGKNYGAFIKWGRNTNKGTESKVKAAWRKNKITNINRPYELQPQPQT